MRLKNEIFVSVLDWLVKNKGIDGQKGLAEATGISTNTISRIVTGKVQPSASTLRALADKFDLNMDYLRGYDPDHMLLSDLEHDAMHQAPVVADTHESPSVDSDFYHKALDTNAKIIEDMRKDIEYFQQLVLDKDALIQDHNEQIVALNIDKAKLATELEHLRTTLDAVRNNFDVKQLELEKRDQLIKTLQAALDREQDKTHPFPMGTAEPPATYNNDKK